MYVNSGNMRFYHYENLLRNTLVKSFKYEGCMNKTREHTILQRDAVETQLLKRRYKYTPRNTQSRI